MKSHLLNPTVGLIFTLKIIPLAFDRASRPEESVVRCTYRTADDKGIATTMYGSQLYMNFSYQLENMAKAVAIRGRRFVETGFVLTTWRR